MGKNHKIISCMSNVIKVLCPSFKSFAPHETTKWFNSSLASNNELCHFSYCPDFDKNNACHNAAFAAFSLSGHCHEVGHKYFAYSISISKYQWPNHHKH